MLLDSETAIKVSRDVIHDIEEIVGKENSPAKWKRLLGSVEDEPAGYVDFDFSDGAVLRVPCVWAIRKYGAGAARPSLIFTRNGVTATWTPGNINTARGRTLALISDTAAIVGDIVADAIVGIEKPSGAPVEIAGAGIPLLAASALTVAHSAINRLTANNVTITGATFSKLEASNGVIIARLDTLDGYTVDADMLRSGGEQATATLKMNGWPRHDGAPVTDAEYTGYIPFMPLTDAAQPINGFDNPLQTNQFFPDWYYICDVGAYWMPTKAWVPSLTRPGRPSWQDEDGIYWYQVEVTTNPYTSAYQMIYPPLCRVDNTVDRAAAPFKKEADGLIVTVKIVGANRAASKIIRCERFEYLSDDLWAWNPMPGGIMSIRGDRCMQFVAKRSFHILSGRINYVDYQLLPLGDSNADA